MTLMKKKKKKSNPGIFQNHLTQHAAVFYFQKMNTVMKGSNPMVMFENMLFSINIIFGAKFCPKTVKP